MLDGEVSQDCRGRGPPFWAWWPVLWTEPLKALTPAGQGTTVRPASSHDQKPNGGNLQKEVWSFFVQREFGIPSFRTAQGAYFQVEASGYLDPCGPFLVVDMSPVSRMSLKRHSPWAVLGQGCKAAGGSGAGTADVASTAGGGGDARVPVPVRGGQAFWG